MEKEKILKSWFLGPKGENADILEKLIIEVFRDHVYWRRNFHPEDGEAILESEKLSEEFSSTIAKLKEILYEILSKLKMDDVPFFSPRYIGHMTSDLTIPSLIGYISTIFYDPNNVTSEASPYTTILEIEVGKQLGEMLGYDKEKLWGHITSGGTIANIEALWVARNIKYFPLAVKKALETLTQYYSKLSSISFTVNGKNFNDFSIWELLNLSPEISLNLRNSLVEKILEVEFEGNGYTPEEKKEIEKNVDTVIYGYSLHRLGFHRFLEIFKDDLEKEKIKPGVVIVPQSKHYSLVKAVELLGMGSKDTLVFVPLAKDFSIKIEELEKIINNCKEEKKPIIAVVGVIGTTEEGAIDDIGKIEEIRKKNGIQFWLHADAAWGGYFTSMLYDGDGKKITSKEEFIKKFTVLVDPERNVKENILENLFDKLIQIKLADSVTIDPHKQGYVPYPCGAIIFKNKNVKDLLSFQAPYIFHISRGKEKEDDFIGRYILEGSKPGASAASCYLSHKVIPLNWDGYGYLMGRTITACWKIYKRIKEIKINGIKIVPIFEPQSNLLDFIVNFEGNTSLPRMNNLINNIYKNLSIYLEKRKKPLQLYESLISKTEFHYEEYNSDATLNLLDEAGIPRENFVPPEKIDNEMKADKISILRMTCMNPFLLYKETGNYKYIEIFIENLKKVLKKFTFRVFIFEDNESDYNELKDVIMEIGKSKNIFIKIEPESNKTCNEAIKILKEKKEYYDFYIVDMMEKGDAFAGCKVINCIRRGNKYSAPIIIYTEYKNEMLKKAKYNASKYGWGENEDDVIISKKEERSKIIANIVEKLLNIER